MISTRLAHPPLVSEVDFVAVQAVTAVATPKDGSAAPLPAHRLVICRFGSVTDHNGDLAFEDLQAHRNTALTAFLAAGTGEPFSRAAAVTALATALRAAALHRDRGIPIDGWLAGQIRLRGIRENAAIVAVMRCMTQRRAEVADPYRRRHPDRTRLLDELLAVLDDRID